MFPAVQHDWTPATFRERGVAVPFTSPMLAGARVRLVERRYELVLPHPGRARGVYIFALLSLAEYCAPTLHDLRLANRLADLGQPTPAKVRLAARKVALEGGAGRAAAAGAALAERRDASARADIELRLLSAAMGGQTATGAPDPLLARAALLKLAGRTGRTPEAVKAEIERLANELVAAGLTIPAAVGSHHPPARCELLLDGLAEFAGQTRQWLGRGLGEPEFGRIAAVSLATQKAGRLVLDATHAAISDLSALLSLWGAEPDHVMARLGRLDWLLDGWEHVCLLWQVAETDAARHQALEEATSSLPMPPAEAQALFRSEDQTISGAAERPAARAHPVARPAGDHLALVERNERIRALAA